MGVRCNDHIDIIPESTSYANMILAYHEKEVHSSFELLEMHDFDIRRTKHTRTFENSHNLGLKTSSVQATGIKLNHNFFEPISISYHL